MTDKTSRVILKYEVDQTSLNRVAASTDQITRKIRSLGDVWEGVGSKSQKAGTSLSRAIEQSAGRRGYDQLRSQMFSGGGATSTAGGSNFRLESLRRAGGAVSALGLPQIGEMIQRVGDVGEVSDTAGKLVEKLGISMTSLAAAGGLAAAAVGILFLGIQNYNNIIKEGSDNLKKASLAIQAYYEAVATGTTESIQKQLAAAQAQKTVIDAELKLRQEAAANAFKAEQSAFGGDAVARLKFALAGMDEGFKASQDRIDALKKQAFEADAKVQGLTQAISSSAVAANDLAEKEAKLAQARRDAHQQELDVAIEGSRVTTKQAEDKIAAMEAEAEALKKWLEKHAEAAASDEAIAALYDENEARLKKLMAALELWKGEILDGAKAADKAAKMERNRADNSAEVEAQYKATADAYTKYEQQVENIEQSALEKRAEIQQQYNDKLVEIAQTAAQDAADALRELEQQRADLLSGLSTDLAKIDQDAARQELDIRINAAREDEKAARDHALNLARIREDAADREFDMILNRDFLALFQSRRQTSRSLQRANEDYLIEQRERQIATVNEINDLRASIAQQRAERILQYQQELQDAALAYQRKMALNAQQEQAALQQAAAYRNRELQEAAATRQRQLEFARTAAIREIQMAQMTADARIKLLQAEQRAAYNAALAMVAGSSSQRFATSGEYAGGFGRASGGPVLVNEPWSSRSEGFNGIPFPRGMGVFYPTQSGSVNRNMTMNNNISGNNPDAIWRVLEPRIVKTVGSLLGVA